jgi:hypothetical protein
MTVAKRDEYSLRLYEPFVALQVPYEKREQGYDAAASYFGGLNAAGVTFEETQPTILNFAADGSKCMQLFVGPTRAGEHLEDANLPAPDLPGCKLVAAGAELCGVLRFEGYITPESAAKAVQALQTALERDGVELMAGQGQDAFRVLQYGPVYSLSGRENEVLLRCKVSS